LKGLGALCMSLRAEVADHSFRSRLMKTPRGLKYL